VFYVEIIDYSARRRYNLYLRMPEDKLYEEMLFDIKSLSYM